MPADPPSPDPGPPGAVRAAAAMIGLQGATSVVLAVVFAVRAVAGHGALGVTSATAGWFTICGAALLGAGVALWRGSHGARGPAVVAQLLLLGVAWYAAGPSSQPEYGVPGGLYCAVVLLLLFSAPAIRWSYGGDISGDRRAG